MEFSVVIPLYNEEENLQALNEDVFKTMQEISQDYEIIYVDDASRDSSLDILKTLKASIPQIRIISFKKNQGQSTALFAGFKEARGRWLITLDADLQNPPQEITKFLKYRENFDFITGIRKKRKDNLLRKASSLVAKFFRWLILKDKTQDVGCSLRVFKKEVTDKIPFFKNFHRFFPLLVKLSGFRVKEIEIFHQARAGGKSKYSILKRAREGVFDLIGLFWLKRRLINYEVKYRS